MNTETSFEDVLEPILAKNLREREFESLTSVQLAVLDPAASGRDLRISSQTGSGKTLAVGMAIRELLTPQPERVAERAVSPRALVITPTRELARQFEEELTWFYAGFDVRLTSVTGGASYRDEHRALARRPDVIVGTPGRLLDHLEAGVLDLSGLGAIALDEADRMLDLGFREALEAIFARTPEAKRCHLVSATFPPEVRHLADRAQRNPLFVQGTRLGAANVDIEHVVHLVDPRQRFDALVNVLLAHPDECVLVFARTRTDVADITDGLRDAGFDVASLSGEMQQRERTRALAAFKSGKLRALVATDVAARGIDAQISLVVHVEPPTDADSYTHRSGRTGRAGNKGTSVVLVAPRELSLVRRVLGRAKVRHRMEPLPTAQVIREQTDGRLIEKLTSAEGEELETRTVELARRLVEAGDVERTIARLLATHAEARGPAPREVRSMTPAESPSPRAKRTDRHDRIDRHTRSARKDHSGRRPDRGEQGRPERAERGPESWVTFEVTYGERHGADARRMLAMICRRGKIASHSVGKIRIGAAGSEVEIAEAAAERFAEAVRRPDRNARNVHIRPSAPRARSHARSAAR